MRILALALFLASETASLMPGTPPQELMTLPTPSPIRFFNLARSGSLAAAVCRDHQLRLWALPQGRLVSTVELGDQAFEMTAISGDGRSFLVADHSGSATVWDTSAGKVQWQIRLAHYPGLAVFSHNGRLLALTAQGDPVQVFDLAGKRKLYELEQTAGGTAAAAFSRDGALLATADADTGVRVYDGHSGKLVSRNGDFLGEPLAVDFTADGKQVVAAGADKAVAVIDAASGRLLRHLAKTAEPVAYLEVSPRGGSVATLFMNAENLLEPAAVTVWDIASGRRLTEWLPPSLPIGGGWTVDDHLLVATATPEAVHFWRVW